jgi:hypothetical protein
VALLSMSFRRTTKFSVGEVVGELTLVRFLGCENRGPSRWEVECSCGTIKSVLSTNIARLDNRGTKTCGDRSRHPKPNTRHGMASTLEYRCWKSMLRRGRGTGGERERSYYFDRGIRVCGEWIKSFTAFFEHIGPMSKGHRIGVDRIDNDRGYEPGNVRWATPKQQCNNKRPPRRKRAA